MLELGGDKIELGARVRLLEMIAIGGEFARRGALKGKDRLLLVADREDRALAVMRAQPGEEFAAANSSPGWARMTASARSSRSATRSSRSFPFKAPRRANSPPIAIISKRRTRAPSSILSPPSSSIHSAPARPC